MAEKPTRLDWDNLRRHAYSAGVGVEEFWRCTLREVQLACEAHSMNWETGQTIAAWHICCVGRMLGSKNITVEGLLGKRKSSGKPMSRSQVLASDPRFGGGGLPSRDRLTRMWAEKPKAEVQAPRIIKAKAKRTKKASV